MLREVIIIIFSIMILHTLDSSDILNPVVSWFQWESWTYKPGFLRQWYVSNWDECPRKRESQLSDWTVREHYLFTWQATGVERYAMSWCVFHCQVTLRQLEDGRKKFITVSLTLLLSRCVSWDALNSNFMQWMSTSPLTRLLATTAFCRVHVILGGFSSLSRDVKEASHHFFEPIRQESLLRFIKSRWFIVPRLRWEMKDSKLELSPSLSFPHMLSFLRSNNWHTKQSSGRDSKEPSQVHPGTDTVSC
jgi:hypothetical protein